MTPFELSRRRLLFSPAALVLKEPVAFPTPWSSPVSVDPAFPHHFVNREGQHVWVLNKTAWAYFGCNDPEGFLKRAADQGVTVIRVALEGTPYFQVLGIDMWPWGGSRQRPVWDSMNLSYWDEVERRVRLAGEAGIGLDVVLYFTLRPTADDVDRQRRYWDEALERLSKYSNIFTWEIHNEYLANEAFQDAAGSYFKKNDPYRRPVCTSDGTTDDAAWPHKSWMDIAVVHTCTGSTPEYDLRDWYHSVARNVRSYGKPAFNNESGREVRHRNDDPVHRRKQGWIWCMCGGYWTWHSWEGCEGIDDPDYRGPGVEYLKPMSSFFQSLPFWNLNPNFTVLNLGDSPLLNTSLAAAARDLSVSYLCTRETGRKAQAAKARLRLTPGAYRVRFFRPADMTPVGETDASVASLGRPVDLSIPEFEDDLLVRVDRLQAGQSKPIKGTR